MEFLHATGLNKTINFTLYFLEIAAILFNDFFKVPFPELS